MPGHGKDTSDSLPEALAEGVLDSLRDHVAVLRRDGTIIAVNEAWRQFAAQNDSGSQATVSEGVNYLDVCRRATGDGDDFAERALAGIEDVLSREIDVFSMEYPCSSPDEERWFLMKVVPLKLPDGGCVVSHANITAWKNAERELLASEGALRESREDYRTLARKLLTATEDARRRLARELHDDISQRLALLSMEAGKLVRAGSKREDIPAGLIRIQEQVASLSEDMHAIARQLHPSILDDLGLDDAVAAACSSFSDRAGILVEYQSDRVPEGLDPEVSLNIYRIIQEALNNTVKHADASKVTVSLAGKHDAIHLSIKDDGMGFDRADLRDAPGLGLASIHERVDLMKGALTIKTAPGKGTEIRVVVPVSGADGRR
jgi:signal transduction histidine kinase